MERLAMARMGFLDKAREVEVQSIDKPTELITSCLSQR